jgi:DNA-binding NarL/FixJ family response regulator
MASNHDADSKTNSACIDDLDLELLTLLARGTNKKQISTIVNIPLSTIQKGIRKIFEKELLLQKLN